MKKVVMVFFAFLLLVSGVSARTHPASDFVLNVDGNDRTLQYAYDNDLLTGSHTYSDASASNLGHSVSEIWISTFDGEMTFLDALTSGIKLIGDATTYTNVIVFGHYASDVIFDGVDEYSLQDIINGGAICTPDTCADHPGNYGTDIPDGCVATIDCSSLAPAYTYSWYTGSSSHNNHCPLTYTRTVYCERSDGANMGSDCGVYSGCGCPTPWTTNVADCTWYSINEYCSADPPSDWCGWPTTYASQACSPYGATKTCRKQHYDWPGISCDCGDKCSGIVTKTLRCGNYLD